MPLVITRRGLGLLAAAATGDEVAAMIRFAAADGLDMKEIAPEALFHPSVRDAVS